MWTHLLWPDVDWAPRTSPMTTRLCIQRPIRLWSQCTWSSARDDSRTRNTTKGWTSRWSIPWCRRSPIWNDQRLSYHLVPGTLSPHLSMSSCHFTPYWHSWLTPISNKHLVKVSGIRVQTTQTHPSPFNQAYTHFRTNLPTGSEWQHSVWNTDDNAKQTTTPAKNIEKTSFSCSWTSLSGRVTK